MKYYWPKMVYRKGSYPFGIQWTYNSCLSFEKAEETINIWKDDYSCDSQIASIWTEIVDSDHPDKKKVKYLYVDPDVVMKIWSDYKKLKFDSNDRAMDFFGDIYGGFCKGDSRKDILDKFERLFNMDIFEMQYGWFEME